MMPRDFLKREGARRGERPEPRLLPGDKNGQCLLTLPFIAELPSFSGAYDKPSLSSVAGTVVAPGESVKLQCFSKFNHDVFILTKEDGDHITQNQSCSPQDTGCQTIFLLNPVSSTQPGTYRCYGAFGNNPYVWSQPSDPLQLQVEGEEEAQSTHLLPALGADSVRLKHWLGKGPQGGGGCECHRLRHASLRDGPGTGCVGPWDSGR